MIQKALFILTSAFIFQVVISCRCDEASTFEVNYNEVLVQAYNTSGFQPTIITDTVYKNAFGLTVSVNFDLIQIAEANYGDYFGGFKSACAFSCPEDEYVFVDPIAKVEIYSINQENLESTDVTDYFVTYDYSGNQVSVSELFEIHEDWHDGFQFDLKHYESIPDSIVFSVKIFLESGKELVAETTQINFFS